MVWKKWKTLAVLQAACKERDLDTSGCNVKREYCQLLNDYEDAQAATQEGAYMPSLSSTEAPKPKPKPVRKPSHEQHQRQDSKNLTTTPQSSKQKPPATPQKPKTPATRQDLRDARRYLQTIYNKIPQAIEEAQKLNISSVHVAPEGKAISWTSDFRSGILTFNVEEVSEEDLRHYLKATRAQIEWTEAELKPLFDLIVATQRRNHRDRELVKEDSSGQLEAMLSLVSELVTKRNGLLERASELRFVEVEDSYDWVVKVHVGLKKRNKGALGELEERLGDLEREATWLDEDIGKWEQAILEYEELMR